MSVNVPPDFDPPGLTKAEAGELAGLLNNPKPPWYYRYEVSDGVWTTNARYRSVGVTRTLLGRTDLRGASVLDLGTMEGMVPLMAKRGGAERVVAFDRLLDRGRRIELMQKIFGLPFEFTGGVSLSQFQKKTSEQFDVVVFSGVLYHMFDPFGGLARAYSFVRPGGIFIVETACIVRKDCALHFNEAGKYYQETTTYFMPTPSALDNFLRYLGAAVIDMEYYEDRTSPQLVIRIGLACQVRAEAIPMPNDKWMAKLETRDLREFGVRRSPGPKKFVGYKGPDRSSAWDARISAVRVLQAVNRYQPIVLPDEMSEMSLKLRRGEGVQPKKSEIGVSHP